MKIREILAPGNETRIDSALDKLIEVKKNLRNAILNWWEMVSLKN